MLSGGLDTSSITSCLFAEYKHSVTTKVKPYSITFKDLKKRDIPLAYETNYINDVCSKYNAQPNLIDLPYYDIQMELAEIQGMYPEPNYHGNKYMDLAIIDSMKKDGCQIIFSGFDGDSILTHGEQYLYELGSNYKFKRLLNETRARSLKRNQEYKPLSDIKKYFISPKIPNLIFHLKSLMGYQLPAKQTSRFLKKSISDELPINDMTRNYLNSRKNFKKFHLNTINTNTWEHIFEIQDIDYGRNGLEVRYPFMDRRLISFCLSLPNDQKLKNGISRYILRNAMKGIIPDSVYNRMSKSILSPYYDYSFENQFDFMKREVINSSNYLDKILDKDYIRKLNLGNINLNESIILQHIFILNKWLDFQ